MKKILLFVFLFLLTVPVQGLESSQVIKYKYYRLNEVLGPYVYKDEVTSEYPLIDEDDYVADDISELSTEEPDEKDGRVIYEYDGYHYLEAPKFNEIELVVSEGSALYDIGFTTSSGTVDFTTDNESSDLLGGERATYKFDESFYYGDLYITCTIPENETNINHFYFYLKYNGNLVKQFSTYRYGSGEVKIATKIGSTSISSYHDLYSLEKLTESENLVYQSEVKLYQYQDYKFRSYRLEKEYYDEYLLEPFEDYIYKDENDFIIVDEDVSNEDDLATETLEDGVFSISEDLDEDVSSQQLLVFYGQNDSSSTDNLKTVTAKNTSFNKTDIIDDVIKNSQYQQVLKLDNTSQSTSKSDNTYDYLKLIILIILLLLVIKLRNKVKEYARW